MIYLASPYTHPDPDVQQKRYEAVCQYLVEQLNDTPDDIIYAPIAKWHPIAKYHRLPTDYRFWLKQDTMYIRLSKEVRVLQIPGWRESKGVLREVDLAVGLFIPVHFVPWGLADAYP